MSFASRASWLAIALMITLALAGSATLPGCGVDRALRPQDGRFDYQEQALFPVPGGWVNLAGGNLHVRRVDLSIDTRLGPYELAAVYNSASPAWRWSFELHFDGQLFVDASGAEHPVADLPAGSPIPGTVWTVVDGRSIQTRGGLVYGFDGAGRLESIHWRSSAFPRIEFHSGGPAGHSRSIRIEQCKNPTTCSLLFDIDRDSHGRVVEVRDRADRRARYTWTGGGRLETARDGLDVARGWPGYRYEYNSAGRLVVIENSEGERTVFEYWRGRVSAVERVGDENPRTRFRYDREVQEGESGQEVLGLFFTLVRDPLGASTLYRYDDQARLHTRIDPGEERWDFEWEGLRPRELRSPWGGTTTWVTQQDEWVERLDPSGNRVRRTLAIAAENRRSPDRRAWTRYEDDLGLIEERQFDSQGRVTTRIAGDGSTTHIQYDNKGRIQTVVAPDGGETHFSGYGEHGHATRIEREGGVEERSYDSVGNWLTGRDFQQVDDPGRPGIVARAYDEDRNLAALTLANQELLVSTAQAEVRIEFRSDGQVLRVRRPYGGDWVYDYDTLGRPVAVRERSGGEWHTSSWSYDPMGRPLGYERANGMRREFRYDEVGRIAELRWLRDGALENRVEFTRVDALPTQILDTAHGAPESALHDVAGRVVTRIYPAGERLEIERDLRGRELLRRYLRNDGVTLRTIAFAYDGAGRRVRVEDGGELILARSYEGGRLAEEVFGNQIVRTYRYDGPLRRLSESWSRNQWGDVVEHSVIGSAELCEEADLACHLVRTTTFGSVSAESSEFALLVPQVQEGQAQPGTRVQSWSSDPEAGLLAEGRIYRYDELGNLVVATAGSQSDFIFNLERNRLSSGAGHTYEYDDAGFAVARDGEPLTWSAQGRIAAIGTEWSFEWDSLGRPLARGRNGQVTRFRFGGAVEADVLGTPLALEVENIEIRIAAGERRYRHLDYRGNVKLVTDDTGDVVRHYEYSGYGVEAVHGAGEGTRSFAGGRTTGDLMLLGMRLYDPAVGRFLSPDPVPQLVNQYAYTLGNPIWLWDPGGTQALPVSFGDGANQLFEVLVTSGTVIAGAGLAVGNVPAVATGSVMMAIGITGLVFLSIDFIETSEETDPVPSGEWLEVSGGGVGNAAGGTFGGGLGPGSSRGSSGSFLSGGGRSCSPLAALHMQGQGELLWWLIPLQLLALGLWWFLRRRGLG